MPHTSVLSGHALDGRYELLEVIGEGTFGRVYRGRDQRLARLVAIKVIKPWWTEDPHWARSFEREAQLMARVNDPGIVQIFDIGYADEGLYYVAELVDGESLADRLRDGPLEPADALEVAEQLCRALAHAHAERVVHRDVKPANVLISTDGRVKVGDFGIARLAEGTTDGVAGTIVGTPRYMAPEQARGRPTSPATDVYGVGVVLYEMLAGRTPFTEKSAVELAMRHVCDPVPPLPSATPHALVEIVERALAKNPAERFPTAEEMANALAEARPSVGDGRAPAFWLTPRSVSVSAGVAPCATTAATPKTATRAKTATAATSATRRDATALTALVERPAERVAATRVAPRRSPRRDVNPPERRRYFALLGLVLLILIGLVVGAIISAGGQVKVPNLRGMSRAGVTARTRALHLHAAFRHSYSHAARGTVIAQHPAPPTRVDGGATVTVTLSAGPAPIPVPQLVGQTSADASSTLRQLGLGAAVTAVAAPGVTPGTVVRQTPGAGNKLAPHSTVSLSAAETPRWRSVTSFSADGSGRSVPFQIRGNHWQIVYRMGYDGTCTLIFFCSGPGAQVNDLSNSSRIAQFGLGEGNDQTRVFKSGPGVYQITVSPGGDSAHWSIDVQDYY